MNRNIISKFLAAGAVALLGLAQAQQPLTPADDWLGALRAGGNVVLGAGAFYTTEPLELGNSVSVTGQGTGVTSLWLASDGGEYREQLALLQNPERMTRYEFTDMDISGDTTISSDLISIWGNAYLNLTRVSVNYSYDDYAYFDDNNIPWRGSGLLVGAGATVLVNDSIFYGNATNGITVAGAERLVVQGSTFQDNMWAGIMTVDSPITVTGNHFQGNDTGIEVYGVEPATIARNTFANQTSEDVFRGE